jgi:hypothetical protein
LTEAIKKISDKGNLELTSIIFTSVASFSKAAFAAIVAISFDFKDAVTYLTKLSIISINYVTLKIYRVDWL